MQFLMYLYIYGHMGAIKWVGLHFFSCFSQLVAKARRDMERRAPQV